MVEQSCDLNVLEFLFDGWKTSFVSLMSWSDYSCLDVLLLLMDGICALFR